MTDYRLGASGPHSAEHTLHAAEALAEAVRVLNHATRTQEGVPDPQTVHALLGHLHAATAGIDQLLHQLSDNLARFDCDDLADDSGNAGLALGSARWHLSEARPFAEMLADLLSAAHTATSGLYLRDGSE